MEFPSQLKHLFLLHFLIQVCGTAVVRPSSDCPSDCACYHDYLTNLASWRWLDTENTPEDEYDSFLEHNEVYDNPAVTLKNQRRSEPLLKTVTCIIRSTEEARMNAILAQIPADTQMLSILQAQGSGNLTLKRSTMDRFHSLVGLELQGVTKNDPSTSILRLSADALSGLKKLTYLNLEKVLLEQRQAQAEPEEEIFVRVRKVGEEENESDNSVHLLYVGEKKENVIVPYSEYKKNNTNDLPPPAKNVDAKIAVAFTQLNNLIHLRISGCNMLDISWDMFYKMGALKYLLLENNDLLFLPDFVFYATPNLTALSLAGNRILNLQTVGLAGLLRLEKLDVTHNNITHLSELSLPPFPHLEIADFRYNPIQTIFPNTFEVMNSTKELYLGNPSVPLEFLANSFYGLTSLEKLEVKNAKVGALERPMLRGMPELINLKLDGSIPRILYDAFADLPKLETLNLKGSALKKISMDAFYGLNNLKLLDLSHNDLSYLPPGVFDEQRSLQDLYLGHNKLETLPPGLFDNLPVKLVRLDGNPWHCSCEMISWNPIIINVVKRNVAVRNMTLCDRALDKGACNEEVTLQIKYVHEKRVSPICNSPTKFMKKSVFQVLRKGLHQCVVPLKKGGEGTASKVTTSKPIKVKKPRKETTSGPRNETTSEPGREMTSTAPTTTTEVIEEVNSISLLAGMDPLLQSREPYYRQVIEARLHPLTEAGARLKAKMQNLAPFSHRINIPKRQMLRQPNFNQRQPNFNQTNNLVGGNVSKKSLKLAKMLKSRQLL